MSNEEEMLLNTISILGILVENLDELERQKFYARNIKFHSKSLIKEIENTTSQIFNRLPEADRKQATDTYMKYYNTNADLLKLIINMPLDKKNSIFELLKK